MSEAKLLPCPFCGERVELYVDERNAFLSHRVMCDACGASGPPQENQTVAETSWNVRNVTGTVHPLPGVSHS